ncbi:GNAT family N-acetyltransferase [Muricauda sp. ANG21]|uniref:GNAT family N-acetyltransferase n=1 Tax=Allomuricauda sp. ANG21 TaxID=3042468 RepID=UPI0034519204
MMVLRRANRNDLKELQSLYIESIEGLGKLNYTDEQLSAWKSSVNNRERWTEAINNQHFLIAQINKKIVGFGSLENGSYIDFLYVSKNHSRMGVASRIFERLEKAALKLDQTELESDVSLTAEPFFKSKGFQTVRENKNIIQGIEITNLRMKKKLK